MSSYHIKFYLWGIYNWPLNNMSLNCTSKLVQRCFFLINILGNSLEIFKSFPGDSEGKESDCSVRDLGLIPELERTWRREWLPNASLLAWRIPWTEETGELQSLGSQRVRHDWVANTIYLCFWRFSTIWKNIGHKLISLEIVKILRKC